MSHSCCVCVCLCVCASVRVGVWLCSLLFYLTAVGVRKHTRTLLVEEVRLPDVIVCEASRNIEGFQFLQQGIELHRNLVKGSAAFEEPE